MRRNPAPPARFAVGPGNIDTALRYKAVVDRLADGWSPGLRILEVGSGSGGVTEFLDHPVTGVDSAFDRTGERATGRLTRVVARAEELPFDDGSFDRVLCLEMLEHIPPEPRARALREMLRVLAPGGRLLLTFPAGPDAEALDRWLVEAYRERHGVPHPWSAEHLEAGLPEVADVRAVLEAAGARVEVRRHLSPLGFRLLHGLYTVGRGGRLAILAGLRTAGAARLLFWLLGREPRGRAYRAVVVASK